MAVASGRRAAAAAVPLKGRPVLGFFEAKSVALARDSTLHQFDAYAVGGGDVAQ